MWFSFINLTSVSHTIDIFIISKVFKSEEWIKVLLIICHLHGAISSHLHHDNTHSLLTCWCVFDLFFNRPAVPSGSDLGLRQRHANPQHRHRSRGCRRRRSGKNGTGKCFIAHRQIKILYSCSSIVSLYVWIVFVVCSNVLYYVIE